MRFETNLSAQKLELRTGSYESLTGRIVFEFLEVVDEHFSKLGGFNSPFFSVGVSVAGIEDLGIYAGKFGGNGEVKDRSFLVGAVRIEPSRIASMIPRVSLIEIRLPVPFQPVFTR